jgi:hypothetical protein
MTTPSYRPELPAQPTPAPIMPALVSPYYAPIPAALAPAANLMKNGLGTTSLIFGIIGMAFAPITLAFSILVFPMVFGFGFSVPGLIMGIYGLRRFHANVASNKGVSIAGITLNGLALLVAAIGVIIAVSAVAAGAAQS